MDLDLTRVILSSLCVYFMRATAAHAFSLRVVGTSTMSTCAVVTTQQRCTVQGYYDSYTDWILFSTCTIIKAKVLNLLSIPVIQYESFLLLFPSLPQLPLTVRQFICSAGPAVL